MSDDQKLGAIVQEIDAAVIGGGQAGICLSHYLKERQIDHIVFERDRAFSSWRGRWDGFTTNTPNWMNTLPIPGLTAQPFGDADGFAPRDKVVEYFENCTKAVNPPILERTDVTRVQRQDDGWWRVTASGIDYRARTVALCNGAMSAPRLPKRAADVPRNVVQLHSSQFRSLSQIAAGTVLIVGSASSGVQIARLLCEAGRGRDVHVAVSKVLVLPRHILGMPTHRVIHWFGLFDVRTTSLLGRLMYSGLEVKGDPIMRPTPRDLERQYGAELHGRFEGCTEKEIGFSDGSKLSCDDLTIIWCTGLRPDYSFMILDERDAAFHPSGLPGHVRGVSRTQSGLYFVGLRYQHTVASHDIYGVAEDARFIAREIASHLESAGREIPTAGRDDSVPVSAFQ